MVKVVARAEGMLGDFVEPRVVVGRRTVCVLVQPNQRIGAKTVVGHDVHDDRDAAFVAFVDELFQLGRRAVKLVDGKPEVGVVAPAQVALEFTDRHELDGVEPHVLEVIELVDEVLEGLGFVKIPNQGLVNDQTVRRRTLKVAIGPQEVRVVRAERGRVPVRVRRRERRHAWVMALRNVLVVPRVEHELGVRIANLQVPFNHEMVAVPGAGA